MDEETFLKELNKIFSEMQETLKPWRSSTDPKGSANKVFPSSLLESAIQNFPKFDGSDPKMWIRSCDRAFILHPVPQDMKIYVASSQFQKKAKVWYQLFYARRVSVTWREFSEAVLDRFLNEKPEVGGESQILRQPTSVADSQERNEGIKPSQLAKNLGIGDELFLGGCKSEIRPLMEESKHPDPIIVTGSTQLQEASVEASIDTEENSQPEMYPIILLTQAEMKARWDKDLCYNCDEVYSFEHRCAKIQLYMLKDEEESAEEEVENTEVVIDSGGELAEIPEEEMMVSHQTFNMNTDPKPTLDSNTDPITSPIQIHSSQTTNRNSEPTPNTNPNPFSPPIQTQSFQAVNQNTVAFLYVKRPEPWPNKPPIHTITKEPKPWPNKLPKHSHSPQDLPSTTVIDRGKVHTSEFWPQWTKPPIFTLFNLRTSSDESNGLSKDRTRLHSVLKESLTSAQARSNFYADKRRSEMGLTTVDWVFLGLQTHIQTSVALERISKLDWRGVACQFQLIHWSNTSSFKLEFAEASELATCGNVLKLVVIPAGVSTKPVMSGDDIAAIELLFAIHHISWTAATTPTSFPDENRSRTRPEKQLTVSLLENRTLKGLEILVQLLVFDPGGNDSFEDEGISRSRFWWSLDHFGRIFEGNQLRIEENGRRFSEKRRIGNEEDDRVHRCDSWAIEDLGICCQAARVANDLIWGLIEEEIRDLRRRIGDFISRVPFWKRVDTRSKKMKATAVRGRKQGIDSKPDPIAAFCTLGFGLVGSSLGEPGQTHKWADWAAFAIINSFSFWRFGPPTDLDHYCNWAFLAINFPFQFLGKLGHYFKLPSLRTRMFPRKRECKDWEIRSLIIWGFWQIRDLVSL